MRLQPSRRRTRTDHGVVRTPLPLVGIANHFGAHGIEHDTAPQSQKIAVLQTMADQPPTSSVNKDLEVCIPGRPQYCMAACSSVAHRVASTTLLNSASTLSPAMSITRPPCVDACWSNSARRSFKVLSVAASSCDIKREYPATSAARIAINYKVCPDLLMRSSYSGRCIVPTSMLLRSGAGIYDGHA